MRTFCILAGPHSSKELFECKDLVLGLGSDLNLVVFWGQVCTAARLGAREGFCKQQLSKMQ